MVALWTEVCLAFPALDVLAEGLDVFAVGRASESAYGASFDRVVQVRGKSISWI